MQRRNVALAVAALASVVAGAEASAQEIPDGTITVIQPKPVLRRHRVSLTPRVGTTINDAVLRQWTVGGSLSLNISERLFIGGTFEAFDFGGALGGTTGAYEDVIETTAAVPEVAPLEWYGGLDVGFVPLYGKFVLFNKAIGYFDLYVSAGAGAVSSAGETHGGGAVAAGANLYFNRWLGVNTEFRDRLTIEDLPVGGRSLTNTVTGTVGLVILMPFNFRYTYDEGAQ
ncbi:MAG: outer membrane beta-barrel domain-containing protein [Myxococcales bacterium]|nr:outer membrane beta-barrel domain-containing protein [Myxococcales bacterium]MCB9520583.1 outer membrane beta-barrel domain-containing protein [Myxococcales bacterium]MCB9531506.1 outer membrane beta-barrel domain-containing protein [Myxococcales bacterium]